MLRRNFNLLRSCSKMQIKCHSISSRLIVHCLKTKGYIPFNNYNVQRYNFHESVVNRFPLAVHTLEEKIINLCVHLRSGRIFLDDVEQIIEIYEKTNHEMKNEIGLILLKCCGELLPNVDIKTRQMLTKRVWNIIQKNNSQLTLEHYNSLLEVYAQNSELINPNEFLSNMKIKPNESIYCSLLNVVARIEDDESVSNIISKIKENMDSWDKNTFDTVIEVQAMRGNVTEAYNMIEQMKSCGIKPSPETYLRLAYGFAKMGDIANVIQICEKNQPSVANVMKMIKILSLGGYGEHISSILKFLPLTLKEEELSIINNTIIELVYSGRKAEALKIISDLPGDTEILEGCIEFVKYFVTKEIQVGTLDEDILLVIHKFMHNKHFPEIINEATKIALCHGKETLALALFESMKQNNITIRPHYYWPLLLQAHKSQNEDKIYSLISHMKSFNVEIDSDTLLDYVLPFIDVRNPIATTRKLTDIGINFYTVIPSMSAFLLRNNRLLDVISMCSEFKVKCNFSESCLEKSLIEGYKRNTNLLNYVQLLLKVPFKNNPPYLYILNALLNNSEEVKQLAEFLRILKEQNITLSHVDITFIKERVNKVGIDDTENEIIQNLLNDMNNKELELKSLEHSFNYASKSILSTQPHPLKMGTKELEAHLIELKSKNMNVRGTSKKLLQTYCLNNDLKAAEEIKKQIISNDLDWTPGMSAFLFQLYLRNNMLDKAEAELNEIQNRFSTFMIDSPKILTYAICLVRNNRLKDAFDVINNIKNVNKAFDGTTKGYWLLHEIANSEHYDKTEEMLTTLIKNNYCEINNNLLSPVIARHFLNNDIESAIDAFKYCQEKYNRCPQKQKLLLAILEEKDSPVLNERLYKVLECISLVHGEAIALIQLIVAFARTGEIAKLEKIFKSTDVNMNRFYYQIQKYANKGQVDVLLSIFRGIKNIAHVSKKPLCNLIISIYERNNDYEGAKEFLKAMEDANIEQTMEFKERIAHLAGSNKKRVELGN